MATLGRSLGATEKVRFEQVGDIKSSGGPSVNASLSKTLSKYLGGKQLHANTHNAAPVQGVQRRLNIEQGSAANAPNAAFYLSIYKQDHKTSLCPGDYAMEGGGFAGREKKQTHLTINKGIHRS